LTTLLLQVVERGEHQAVVAAALEGSVLEQV
jgi:hypothetical protein